MRHHVLFLFRRRSRRLSFNFIKSIKLRLGGPAQLWEIVHDCYLPNKPKTEAKTTDGGHFNKILGATGTEENGISRIQKHQVTDVHHHESTTPGKWKKLFIAFIFAKERLMTFHKHLMKFFLIIRTHGHEHF